MKVYLNSENNRTVVWAASSATAREIAESKKRSNDGSKPVETEKRPYRPKVKSKYVEMDYIADELDGLEILHGEFGNVLYKDKERLPPRNDVLKYDEHRHKEELESHVNFDGCPEHLQKPVRKIIEEYWDVFAEEGIKKPIRGYQFNIDTGAGAPVCCKKPRYGPHEAAIITKLATQMEANGLIEDDDGPWGAMVVLAAKPHQEHKHWSDYVWRLCVSYRQLNAVTRPFIFPTRRCDDAARDIGPSKFTITMDLYWGYWQVLMTRQGKGKTAFFIPNGKKEVR